MGSPIRQRRRALPERISAQVAKQDHGGIILLPDTINAGEYRPPTQEEVAATCYRPPPGKSIRTTRAEQKQQKASKQ